MTVLSAAAAQGTLDLVPGSTVASRQPSECLCLSNKQGKTFVVFEDGAIVGWDAQWSELVGVRKALEEALKQAGRGPAADGYLSDIYAGNANTTDSITFSLFDEASESGRPAEACNYVDTENDRFVLRNKDQRHKIPFSYALAQSVKLDVLDASIAPVASSVKSWQQQLAATGKIACDVKSLRQSKTRLLSLAEVLNFKHNTTTTPKLFWVGEMQVHRQVYRDACDHLEIEERGSLLRNKIEAVDESLSYLHDEVHAATMELLTWVIIILIATELVVALQVVHATRTAVNYVFGLV